MQLYSTNNKTLRVSLEEAVFKGLPSDNGLYMPESIQTLDASFFENIENLSLTDIAFAVTKALIGKEISDTDLKKIIDRAITFDAPLKLVEKNTYALELFHGPSLAFKDFGARFMASLIAYFLESSNKPDVNILVATSGDTGSAVAQGFLNMPHTFVTILYPSNKVSTIQEQQLTTLGGNITALEVLGTFDDCQKIVKEAFLDKELSQLVNLTSANSINISRLIPQSFYYFYAYAKLKHTNLPIIFTIPSGNFGNLCGGIIAKRMGLPIAKFIVATNVNDVVPKYLKTGVFTPRQSIPTIANAMDVGNPSNFARIIDLYNQDITAIRNDIVGYSYTDNEIKQAIAQVYAKSSYILDPHGATAYLATKTYMEDNNLTSTHNGVFLETAHPGKFHTDVENAIGHKLVLPNSLEQVMHKPKSAIKINPNITELKTVLLKKLNRC